MAKYETQSRGEDLEAQIASNEDNKIAVVGSENDRPPSGDLNGNLESCPPISSKNTDPTGRDVAPAEKHHDWFHPHIDWRRHHFHLWTAHKLPVRSSEAHAIARAEAASWAQMTPLIAATFGPLAVLLGIPSLTQSLHGQLVIDSSTGSSIVVVLPYPTLNLALSAVVMFFEVLGNVFLVLRFSNFHSKLMTWMSYIFWLAKSVVGIANYIQFGVAHPETQDVVYLQGFWVSSIQFSNYRLVFVVWASLSSSLLLLRLTLLFFTHKAS